MPDDKKPGLFLRFCREANEHYKEHQGGTLLTLGGTILGWAAGWVGAWLGWGTPAAWIGPLVLIVALVTIAAISAWYASTKKVDEYEGRLKRKLRTSCEHGTKGDNQQLDSLRIVVQSDSDEDIQNCQARLTKVKRGEIVFFDDNNFVRLTFMRGESQDSLESIKVSPSVKEFVDVIYVSDSAIAGVGSPSGGRWSFKPTFEDVFNQTGDYFLTVKITGDATPTETVNLKFSWFGSRKTAKLEKLN